MVIGIEALLGGGGVVGGGGGVFLVRMDHPGVERTILLPPGRRVS